MVDITYKQNSLRKAIAEATVSTSSAETIEAIKNKKIPKGDVFEFARAAGLLAVKKTSDIIPDCHPLPVEFSSISYSIDGLDIKIHVEVHTIYKTGVEVEAMHGASIVALTIYDMLKPVDKNIEIKSIKLLSKTGGKSDKIKYNEEKKLSCTVIVCSDSVYNKESEDKTGVRAVEALKNYGLTASLIIIPDDISAIQREALSLSEKGCDIILFAGGTGLSPKDITPDTIQPLLDREIPGVMELARRYGQDRTPYSMLSRGVCGFIKNSLVLTIPGSPSGATDTINALFPQLLHVFFVKEGKRHD
ncbi:MAG: bifunctional molybdenum cofactor biosynthesis protein MoaC/MoaB [Ferruginibacter sp.]|nr:bifunctional molybdenum cofactor biosynthesis protein MoaC/MoaB [Ferruginibacter sp.]